MRNEENTIEENKKIDLASTKLIKRKEREERDKQNRLWKRRHRNMQIVMFIIVAIAVLSCAAYIYIALFMPNRTHVPLFKYYDNLDENKIYIVIGDEQIAVPTNPIERNEEIYLPVSFVKEYLDTYLFWDPSVNQLIITTQNTVMRMRADELNYFVNNKPFTLSLPVYNIDNEAYMPASLLTELYNISISFTNNAYNMAVLDYRSEMLNTAKVISKKASIRYEADIKNPIAEMLETGTLLYVFGIDGDFTRVRTENGLLGYVETAELGEYDSIPPSEPEVVNRVDTQIFTGKFNMVWDQMTTVEANGNENRRIVHKGLDVLSPTWFSFNRETLDGEILNIADKEYVDWAHNQGYQVWALITDNFDTTVSRAVLRDTNIREYVIKQILSFVSIYDLDGINIDFEQVMTEDGPYFIQFLRELYPVLKEQGAVLSVDMYVPKAHTMHYNRTEVAKTADYIVIMGYDEHYSTSPVSGPVASIGFVEEGITETLKEVPKEQVVLGMPYYNRVWREVIDADGKIVVSSSAYGMEYSYNMFIEKGASFVWDDVSACYYGEYKVEENGEAVRYRLWLEDERSIEEKLKLAKKYDLAGVAGWKRNLEKEAIWELISQYMKSDDIESYE